MNWVQYLVEVAVIIGIYYGLRRIGVIGTSRRLRDFLLFAAIVFAVVFLSALLWPTVPEGPGTGAG